jgi:hypothetical protein
VRKLLEFEDISRASHRIALSLLLVLAQGSIRKTYLTPDIESLTDFALL